MDCPLVLLEIDCAWSEAACQQSLPLLADEIQARAARYLSVASRRNLIASRTRLREVLGLLNLEQSSIVVAKNGRPFHDQQRLQFNLSHSHERALLALSLDPALREGLGVDVEWTGRDIDVVGIGKRFFTADEHRWVGSDRDRFLHVWTRKEAILKSNGVGLRVELDSFDVLVDAVGDHVTGQSLAVGTRVRDQGYLVSWATTHGACEPIIVSDREPGWQERVLDALTSRGKE